MKHLKVRATYLPKINRVELLILEQTHRNIAFAVGDIFKPSGSAYALSSRYCPEWDGRIKFLYVRGDGLTMDNHKVLCKVEYWPHIKSLIEAYNEWGTTQ